MAFQKALQESEIPVGQVGKAKIGKKDFAIIHVSQGFFCIDGTCSHEGGPLGEGSLDNGELVCPWHEGRYNYETGAANPETDWVTDVKSYKTKVEAGYVWIDF
jgi:nitrite reductase/ring-hydroxylating ferredoxin subunit